MTALRQLALDLPGRAARGREDFFVAPSNALAVAKIDQWPAWVPPKLIVTGPAGSGKSHLASVWAETSGAEIVQADATKGDELKEKFRYLEHMAREREDLELVPQKLQELDDYILQVVTELKEHLATL